VSAEAGPPAGEVSDDTESVAVVTEPAPPSDDTILDALMDTAGTETVPGSGTEDQPGTDLVDGALEDGDAAGTAPARWDGALEDGTAPARWGPERMAISTAEDAPYRAQTQARRRISRRALIQAGLIGGAGVAALPLLALIGRLSPSNEPLPTNLSYSLNTNWLFGGQYMAGGESLFYDDSGFAPVTLPHAVTPLSWRYWNASQWQQVWIYRRHFTGGPLLSTRRPGNRIIVEFDGVMVNATVVINDRPVSTHQGGYLPFSAELTGHVSPGDNLLSVLVDANCLPVPPMSYGRGPTTVDFFQPGGIYRDVRLRVLPQAFLSDLFVQPTDVLTAQRRVDVECTIDSGLPTHADGSLLVELFDGARLVATQAMPVSLDTPGVTTSTLRLTGLGDITLWSTDNPKLYTVQATLAFPGVGTHVLSRRIGFREASFQDDGFYLNGERLQLFGLNRHQLYPYAGMAMPARVQRRDAEILKNELNCNMVRCSHYPQSPHFLDACDELGLLVWEEAPGWHNTNAALGWQDLVVQNVRDMVKRDRSRPSVIIWGTRLNETPDLPGLWTATKQAAAQLDGSRPSSGAMAHHRVTGWNEDVFAYNDYTHDPATGAALLRPPLTGLPYLVTEAVGVDEVTSRRFSWTDPPGQLARQAAQHGEAQSVARSEPSYSGMLAWAAFDYASPEGLDPELLKYAGVADSFRVPKPGAAIYQSQVDPGVRPVIVPVFFWESGGVFPITPPVMIASNCERLEIFVNGAHVITGLPAAKASPFGDLPYPPFLIQFPAWAPRTTPELMIEGYVGNQQVTELRMSSDPAGDTLALAADDATIVADGSDATRAVFRAVDKYGNQRRYPAGEVTLTLTGPATLIGDNPFAFGAYGGLGAVWIRSLPGQTGAITLAASQSELGHAQVQVRSVPATRGSQLA
jgi:beta-galactosidase